MKAGQCDFVLPRHRCLPQVGLFVWREAEEGVQYYRHPRTNRMHCPWCTLGIERELKREWLFFFFSWCDFTSWFVEQSRFMTLPLGTSCQKAVQAPLETAHPEAAFAQAAAAVCPQRQRRREIKALWGLQGIDPLALSCAGGSPLIPPQPGF